jgi:hypothetical protein
MPSYPNLYPYRAERIRNNFLINCTLIFMLNILFTKFIFQIRVELLILYKLYRHLAQPRNLFFSDI